MEIKIRDLSASRELWKTKALEAQREQEKLQQELEDFKKKLKALNQKNSHNESCHLPELRNKELTELRPKGHSYLVYVIETAIKFLVTGLSSLRGIEKSFQILTENWT